MQFGARPSDEAIEAIETAQHAQASTAAIVPVTEELRRRVQREMAASTLVELVHETLRQAARR